MATITAVDARRSDERRSVLQQPYWFVSGEFTYSSNGKGVMLMSFPTKKGTYFALHYAAVEVTTLWSATSPTIDVGLGTLATDAVTTGGDITIVDADEYIPNADVTATSAGFYPMLTGDAITLLAAGKLNHITAADTTVPVIYATIGGTTLSAGVARVHLLISRIK